MLRRVVLVPIVLAVASLTLGCPTLLGGGPSKSREEAIAACVEAIPAESVLYGDEFAACMEGYGWVHRSQSAATD